MAAPAPDTTSRAPSTHGDAARQAHGTVRPAMTTAHTRPRTASGTPSTTDHELVVTSVQLTMPVSGQANAVGSL